MAAAHAGCCTTTVVSVFCSIASCVCLNWFKVCSARRSACCRVEALQQQEGLIRQATDLAGNDKIKVCTMTWQLMPESDRIAKLPCHK